MSLKVERVQCVRHFLRQDGGYRLTIYRNLSNRPSSYRRNIKLHHLKKKNYCRQIVIKKKYIFSLRYCNFFDDNSRVNGTCLQKY